MTQPGKSSSRGQSEASPVVHAEAIEHTPTALEEAARRVVDAATEQEQIEAIEELRHALRGQSER